MRIGCQPLRTAGQVETVAVPVQNRQIRFRKRAQARSCPLVGQLDTAPADFLDGTRKDPAAERLRHQLAPQADSERWQLPRQPVLDQGNFGCQERIGFGFVGADRSAQNDQQVGISDRVVDSGHRLRLHRMKHPSPRVPSPARASPDPQRQHGGGRRQSGDARSFRRARSTKRDLFVSLCTKFFQRAT